MATANWALASQWQERLPHTYSAFENLVMAMEDAQNNKGKTTFFGNDKGLKSYIKYEEMLKRALFAFVADGLIDRFAEAEKFRNFLLTFLKEWFEIFPNWDAAIQFAVDNLASDQVKACKLISSHMGLSS